MAVVLGIDPGSRVTGFGVVEIATTTPLDWGSIRPPLDVTMSQKLAIIRGAVAHLITHHQPIHIAVEWPFVMKNPRSALILGLVLGSILSVAGEQHIALTSYSPKTIKKSATGRGNATKEHVMRALKMQWPQLTTLSPDAADAIAVAWCYCARSNQ